MSSYHPDKWIIIQIKGEDPHYKVFGCWSGGYLSADSWQLNSGITEVHETETSYNFSGYSGSVYFCGKESYGLTAYGAGVVHGFVEKYTNSFIPLYQQPNIMSLDYRL